jgi:hypothetical protein
MNTDNVDIWLTTPTNIIPIPNVNKYGDIAANNTPIPMIAIFIKLTLVHDDLIILVAEVLTYSLPMNLS